MAGSGMALIVALTSTFALTAYGIDPTVEGSNDPTTAEKWVKITNTYRCMHDVGAVGWSEEAAADAQRYVDTLSTTLVSANTLCLAPPAGPAQENLAKGYTSLEGAVKFWFDENENCRNPAGCEPNPAGLEVRHYTALVWKGVTQIGCAINANASIYICRYRSGDTLGPQTANMPGFFTSSVFAGVESYEKCAETATGTLNPDLPDPISLYPDVPEVGDQMANVVLATCGTGAGAGGSPTRNIVTRNWWIAVVSLSVLALCCFSACCYSCRFISEKKQGRSLPGTMSEMSDKHHEHDHPEERYKSYKESEENRVEDGDRMKTFAKGWENSGIFGGKE